MNYTVDYFISKFSDIPEHLWNVGHVSKSDGTHCAIGHCDRLYYRDRNKSEIESLIDIFQPMPSVKIICKTSYNHYDIGSIIRDGMSKIAAINNGETEQYQQSTPKERILAALNDIKKMQQPTHKDETSKFTSLIPIVDEVSDVVMNKQTV